NGVLSSMPFVPRGRATLGISTFGSSHELWGLWKNHVLLIKKSIVPIIGFSCMLWFCRRCSLATAVLISLWPAAGYGQQWNQPPSVLPGTQSLAAREQLDVQLMDGAHRYIERQ